MACTDVQTIQAGNGTKTQFSFDFPYIFKSEIHVYFWNAVTKEYDEKLTTDATYPWQITDANPTIVEFTGTAPPSPATPTDPGEPTVDNVKIRRITKVDDIQALFNPGSAIRSDDLNKNFEQLRYAVQESNCQGISDELDQYLKDYYWDRYDNTLYDGDTWVSNDTKIATTAALDARFQDEVNDTFTKAELSSASNIMPDDDVAVPTTGALNDYIDEVITNDIGTDGTGITVTDDGDGTITLGLADNTIDFDKIKDADQIKLADQVADPDVVGTDNNIFTAQAATRRFNNYYQNDAPTATDGVGLGQVWLDPDDDLTLSVWSGTNWVGVTSGGTFTNQPKVVYVDAESGDDSNDGHRISRPKKTISAALSDINSDSSGDGSIVSVAPGIYAETLPLDIQKNDIGIIGQSLRTCIIHPKIPTADQASYDVDTPHSQELQTMFRVNSGSYFANLTLTGLKASGTRGGAGSLYTNSTYGLPPNQGWNFAFYPNAVIKKSPYIQNCTNFSDSQINNVNFTPHTPGEGAAGDLDSAPTGGGILVDGSVPSTSSPLRSMVCDSYTHTALDGPGIFITNNGYAQCTSSYAFFNHAHITCINGGQANLAASTTDFGRYGLLADGKSSAAIFTSNVDGAASDGATTFNINEPTAGAGWFGSTERPATNMLVEVNSVIYPILSATANTDSEGGSGWTVTISRPDPNNRSTNLGLNGAISDNAAVSFYLRSMIASSGHTMEYVGSGTDYRALPENGGVPTDANQKIELNNGKIWAATTDHNGKFTVGGNQTDDSIFEVDQQLGFVTIPSGSIAFDLVSDTTPQLGGNLDVNSNTITGLPTTPTSSTEATSKAYVDAQVGSMNDVVDDTTPQLGGDLDVNGNEIISNSNGDITINPDGTGDIVLDAKVGIGTTSPDSKLEVRDSSASGIISRSTSTQATDSNKALKIRNNSATDTFSVSYRGQGYFANYLGLGESSPDTRLHLTGAGSGNSSVRLENTSGPNTQQLVPGVVGIRNTGFSIYDVTNSTTTFCISNNNVGIGTVTPAQKLDVAGSAQIGATTGNASIELGYGATANRNAFIDFVGDTTYTDYGLRIIRGNGGANTNSTITHRGTGDLILQTENAGDLRFKTSATDRIFITSGGNVGIGDTSPDTLLDVGGTATFRRSAGNDQRVEISSTSGGHYITGYSASGNPKVLYIQNNDTSQPIVFNAGGSERMRVNSSGYVGIGTGSPSATLHVYGTQRLEGGTIISPQGTSGEGGQIDLKNPDKTTTGVTFDISTANTCRIFQLNNNSVMQLGQLGGTGGVIEFRTAGTERLKIDSSGLVGIGTTGPNSPLHIYKQNSDRTARFQRLSGQYIDIIQNSSVNQIQSTGKVLNIGTSDNLDFVFRTNNTDRWRIKNNGAIRYNQNSTNTPGFGNTTAGLAVEQLSSGAALYVSRTDSHPFCVNRNNDGTVVDLRRVGNQKGNIQVTTSGATFNSASDYRLKENVVAISDGITRLKQLSPSRFNFIEEPDTTVDGFIAHEVQAVVPEAVTGTHNEVDADGNPVMQGMDYGKVTPLLTAALQEAIAKIETLEAKVAALEAG